MYQQGTDIEGDPRKFEAGRRLRFVAYNPDELKCTPRYVPKFTPGDLFNVAEENPGGMGITVIRESDGVGDMVWPEEVELVDA